MTEKLLEDILREAGGTYHPVVDIDFAAHGAHIDLSKDNGDLLDTYDEETEGFFSVYISRFLKQRRLAAAAGGYLEERSVYQRGEHFFDREEPRTIHLGVDIWLPAGTPVFAPLDGEIQSLQNNAYRGDYGPTMILVHQVAGRTFHTLYGHLTLDSLADKAPGMNIQRGSQLGALGDNSVNGGWFPHLHLQLIDDMQGLSGDYPGVSARSRVDFYAANCPDPNLILQFPQLKTARLSA